MTEPTLADEAELIEETDNGPRPEDGPQPDEEGDDAAAG